MQAVNTHCKFCLHFTASASQKEINVITINTKWKSLKCKLCPCLHQVPNCKLMVYIHVCGANTTKHKIMTEDTTELNLEESQQ